MKILYDELGGTLTIPTPHNPTPLEVHPIYEISETLSTSLGPSGCDKIIQTEDLEIIVTNDGATIMSNLDHHSLFVSMDADSPTVKASMNAVLKIIVELSQAQDVNVGDGTTSVVIIASALLKNLKNLQEKGEHPMRIIKNMEKVMFEIEEFIRGKAITADFNKEAIKAAKTALYSKIVSFKTPISTEDSKSSISSIFFRKTDEKNLADENEGEISKLCLDAVNLVRQEDELDLSSIKIVSKPGASISKSVLVDGILLDKSFSHPSMAKKRKGLIGLLAAPLELPKPKTKTDFSIKNAAEFQEYELFEKNEFSKIIRILKEKNIKILLCQYGFEDELTSMLAENDIMAVRWVGGTEMENVALLLGANIAARIENIEPKEGEIEEIQFGTENEKMLKVMTSEKEKVSKICTIFVRGSTEMTIKESERSIHDALCAVRNLLKDRNIVYGGGAIESDVSNFLAEQAKFFPEMSEIFIAFSRGIQEIPRVLLRNQGMELSDLSKLGNKIGITGDMSELGVFETVNSKLSQIRMAKEVCCRLLKIDEVISID